VFPDGDQWTADTPAVCCESVPARDPSAFQMRARLSLHPVASRVPSGLHSRAATSLRSFFGLPPAAAAAAAPDEDDPAPAPLPAAPSADECRSVVDGAPGSPRRQTRAVPSPAPVANTSPRGLHATPNTSAAWPARTATSEGGTSVPGGGGPAMRASAGAEEEDEDEEEAPADPFADAAALTRQTCGVRRWKGSSHCRSVPSSCRCTSTSTYCRPFCRKESSAPGGTSASATTLRATRDSCAKVKAECRKPLSWRYLYTR
jgi:hypothetical protein